VWIAYYTETAKASDSGGSSGAVIGGAVGGVVVIVVIIMIIILVLIYMRQLHQKRSHLEITNTISDGKCICASTNKIGIFI